MFGMYICLPTSNRIDDDGEKHVEAVKVVRNTNVNREERTYNRWQLSFTCCDQNCFVSTGLKAMAENNSQTQQVVGIQAEPGAN